MVYTKSGRGRKFFAHTSRANITMPPSYHYPLPLPMPYYGTEYNQFHTLAMLVTFRAAMCVTH